MQRKPLTADDKRHGTSVAYRYYGCRCTVCKAAAALAQDVYLADPAKKAQHARACKARTAKPEIKQQRRTYSAAYAKRNPKCHRVVAWRAQGIDMHHWSWAQYLELLALQSNRCLGCGRGLVATKHDAGDGFTVAYVDHDHNTGRVRRLLCRGCNTALGGAGDDPAVLRRLADIQEQYQTTEGHNGTVH